METKKYCKRERNAMKKARVAIIAAVCVVIVLFICYKWSQLKFETQIKSYLAENYSEDKFVINQIKFDYKFRKFVGFVQPAHSNFIFQIRFTDNRIISDYGYRYWEYLVESELDVYLKNSFTYQASTKYGIPISNALERFNAEGQRASYKAVKDGLISAYLWIDLGTHPMKNDELASLLSFIGEKGFVFSELMIEGRVGIWEKNPFEIYYNEFTNTSVEKMIEEWNAQAVFKE